MLGLYSFALLVVLIGGAPYWIYKGLRERKYFGSFRARLGRGLPRAPGAHPLWVHAVSVGEVLAAKPLVRALREACPGLPLVVSTVTLAGQELARRELAGDAHFYFPFDWGGTVDRFLRHFQPRAVVLLETELWPNFLERCARRGIPVLVANGRLSDRSRRRFGRVPRLAAGMLARVAGLGVQTAEDRRRFLAIGADPDRVRITGNLKFEHRAEEKPDAEALLALLRRRLGAPPEAPIVVVGSTMKGEEALALEAFLRVRAALPGARLIVAPRHPERFAEAAALCRASGLRAARRSDPEPAPHAEVLVLDSIGELRDVYRLAAVAVVAGSFLHSGGHNPLEPAALGRPVVFGPGMENFTEAARLLLAEEAARQCRPDELAATLIELLGDSATRARLGERASILVLRNQGAGQRTLELLRPYLGDGRC